MSFDQAFCRIFVPGWPTRCRARYAALGNMPEPQAARAVSSAVRKHFWALLGETIAWGGLFSLGGVFAFLSCAILIGIATTGQPWSLTRWLLAVTAVLIAVAVVVFAVRKSMETVLNRAFPRSFVRHTCPHCNYLFNGLIITDWTVSCPECGKVVPLEVLGFGPPPGTADAPAFVRHACPNCKYLFKGLAINDWTVTCPECGKVVPLQALGFGPPKELADPGGRSAEPVLTDERTSS